MTDDYDPQKDGHDSYYLAIETKRLRGDKHDWVDRVSNPLPTSRADAPGHSNPLTSVPAQPGEAA